MKELFLKNIQPHIEENSLQQLLEDYISGAESAYQGNFWNRYDDVYFYINDFKDFVNFYKELQ